MKHYSILLFIIVYHWFVPYCFVYGNDELLDALEKGITTWQSQIEMKCDYTYAEGIVSDESVAMSFPESFERDMLLIHGKFIKSQKMCFISNNVTFDHYNPLQSRNGIYVVNETYFADYVPENDSGHPDTLFVGERIPEEKILPCPVSNCIVPLNPIIYLSGPRNPNPITAKKNFCKKVPGSHLTVETLEDQVIKITLRYTDTNSNQCVSTLSISVKSGLPIPFEETSEIHYKNGKRYYRKTVGSDFVDVGNKIVVPGRISSCQGPLAGILGTQYENKWQIRHWKAVNNEYQTPQPGDFIIPLSPGTKWGGLNLSKKQQLLNTPQKSFNINNLIQGDVQNSVMDPVVHKRDRLFRLTLFVFGLIMTVIGGILLWKKRKKQILPATVTKSP